MINGIIKEKNGFAVKDFENGKILFRLGNPEYATYNDALESCKGKCYPESFHQYLRQAPDLGFAPTDCTWENLIYEGNPLGVWDPRTKEWRSSRSMMHGAATDEEIAYLDALCFTYESLMAMAEQ